MNELFRFSIKELKWENLDTSRVKGSPPSSRNGHRMVSVGSDLYVFGGTLTDPRDGTRGEDLS
jgi:hypothetical protein